MKTRAAKSDAVRLIADAVKHGWKRSVESTSLCGNVFLVQCSLTKSIYFTNGYHNASGLVLVSFRRTGKGWSVSITASRLDGKTKSRGPWNAQYIINEVNKAEERQNGVVV